MITKIHKSKDLSGTLRYVYREDANPVVVASTATGFDRESVYRELAASSARVARLKEDTTHMILSLPAEDDVSELVWGEIVTEYMEAMGYGECLYVALKHNDTDHPHVHIVASRVDATGHAVDDFYNFPRSERAARMIEARHGLVRVECSWELPGRRVAQGEYHLDRRDGRAEAKERMAADVLAEVKQARSVVELKRGLEVRNIRLVPRATADESKVNGVWFEADGVKVAGSKLDRSLSWNRLSAQLEYRHERDYPSISSAPKTPESDRPTRVLSGEKEALSPRSRGPERALDGGVGREVEASLAEEGEAVKPSSGQVSGEEETEALEESEASGTSDSGALVTPPGRLPERGGGATRWPEDMMRRPRPPHERPRGEERKAPSGQSRATEGGGLRGAKTVEQGVGAREQRARQAIALALATAPRDKGWGAFAASLRDEGVTLVPKGTQGDYGKIRGLYFEHEGVRLPASEVDGEASYGQLSSVLGTLERSHLGDVCRVVAIPGLGDVHVLIAKRRAALAPEKTGPELELPGFVDRDYKGAREKFEEKLAASRARSVEERREVKAPEELNRPGFIDRVYRGPKEKFLDELARYEAGERRAWRGPDPELEARLPKFVDRVYKGPKEKFQEDLRAAGIAYPGDKSGEGELARGVIEGALAGERERARAGAHGASPGGREARRDEREGGGERERDGSRGDGLRRPGFKDFTPVGANEKLLREVKERLGEDAYQRALDARRALGSSEGGKLKDAIGEVERVVSASKRTADEELIARLGGKDFLASVGRLAPEDDSPWDEPVKGSKEFPYTRREVDARIRATGKLLVDVARQPFVGRVRETFDTKAWGRVALIEGEDRVTMMKARENDPRFVPGNVIASTPGERGLQVRSVAKGTRENPYTRHEIQARVAHLTANKPLADVTREPFKGHVKGAFYDERGDRIAVLEGPKQVALVKVSPEDKRIRPDALVITTPTDRGLALSVHARGEKENPYSREEVDAMLARQTTPRITPANRRVVGQVQRTMHVNDGQRVAIISNAKEHAVVPLREDQDVKRGDQVESRPDGRGGVEVKSAGYVLDQQKIEEKVARLESEPAKLTEEPASMQVKEVFVARDKCEVALVADDKHHAVVPTAGLGTKLSRGEAVEVSASSDGVIKVARAPANVPLRPEPTPNRVHPEPSVGRVGLSGEEVRAKVKAMAMGTEKWRPTAEPMDGKVVDKFVIDGKGEAVLVVGEKKHTIVLTRGNEDKLDVGKKVALSPDGRGDVKVDAVREQQRDVSEKTAPSPAQISERARPVRGEQGRQGDFKAVMKRVEPEAKLEKATPSALDRARPDKDGNPPPVEQRPTMKEWLKAQQEKGAEVSPPIERGVIRGKVEREPIYLEEGKHYVISEDNGSKRLDPSPKLEEHRGKQTKLMRAGKDEMVSTLEVSRGRSR